MRQMFSKKQIEEMIQEEIAKKKLSSELIYSQSVSFEEESDTYELPLKLKEFSFYIVRIINEDTSDIVVSSNVFMLLSENSYNVYSDISISESYGIYFEINENTTDISLMNISPFNTSNSYAIDIYEVK